MYKMSENNHKCHFGDSLKLMLTQRVKKNLKKPRIHIKERLRFVISLGFLLKNASNS